MKGATATKVRAGRPPLAQAGEVETRILDAAARVFLERGFVGATYDQIAEAAQAGKGTLYARYPDKEALFTAVISRKVDRTMRLVGEAPGAMTTDARLRLTLRAILTNVLSDDALALMRVVIAAMPQFPLLGRLLDEYARQRAIGTVTAIVQEIAQPRQPAEAVGRLLMDLTLAPLVLRALMGEELVRLRAEIPARIDNALDLLRAGGRIALPDNSK